MIFFRLFSTYAVTHGRPRMNSVSNAELEVNHEWMIRCKVDCIPSDTRLSKCISIGGWPSLSCQKQDINKHSQRIHTNPTYSTTVLLLTHPLKGLRLTALDDFESSPNAKGVIEHFTLLFHSRRWAFRLASSAIFQSCIMLLILLNLVMLGVEVDVASSLAPDDSC